MRDKSICKACGTKLHSIEPLIRKFDNLAQWLGCSVEYASTLHPFTKYYGRFCEDGCKRYYGFVSTPSGHVYRNLRGVQLDFTVPAPETLTEEETAKLAALQDALAVPD